MSPQSEVSDSIVKPLVPSQFGNAIFSTLQQLNQSQWYSPSVLAAAQLSEIKKLLAYAHEHSSFYRERLAGLDIPVLTMARFTQLPTLSRTELQQKNQQIDCAQLPPGHGSKKETRTSGSTGTPVAVRNSGLDSLMWNTLLMRDHLWHGRNASGRVAAIRWRSGQEGMAPDGIQFKDWGKPINLFYSSGASHYLNSSNDISAQLRWLAKVKPDYLITHPSNLSALLAAAAQSQLGSLQQIHTVGEAVSEQLRDQARELTGRSLVDFYSCQEVGYMALQCPDYEHYHVQSENILLEVVREDGRPCLPGETGKVLVTALRNYATPLIRYEIGDYAEVGHDCPCGRGLPVLTQIHGRVRNMLRHPSGELRWPNFGFGQFIDVAPIQQFQVVQKSLTAIVFRAVVRANHGTHFSPAQEANIIAILREHLGFDFAVAIEYHQSLTGENGKFEDFVSELSP